MLNPMKLMKLKTSFEKFTAAHPQLTPFWKAVYPQKFRVGTVVEITVTAPDDKPLRYRMTVTEDDMALFAAAAQTIES